MEGLLRDLAAQQVHTTRRPLRPRGLRAVLRRTSSSTPTPRPAARDTPPKSPRPARPCRTGADRRAAPPAARRRQRVRQATWQAASGCSWPARARACDAATDIGQAAFDRAARALTALWSRRAGAPTIWSAASRCRGRRWSPRWMCDRSSAARAACSTSRLSSPSTTVLAAGFATESPGRTRAAYGCGRLRRRRSRPDVVRGWRLDSRTHWLRPLTAAEVFAPTAPTPPPASPSPRTRRRLRAGLRSPTPRR